MSIPQRENQIHGKKEATRKGARAPKSHLSSFNEKDTQKTHTLSQNKTQDSIKIKR